MNSTLSDLTHTKTFQFHQRIVTIVPNNTTLLYLQPALLSPTEVRPHKYSEMVTG